MAIIQIKHHSPLPNSLPGESVFTITEMGKGVRSVYRNLNTHPAQSGGGPSVVPGTPLTEQCTTGMIQVDRVGVRMDDREFAALPSHMRNQIAALMEKGYLDVDLDGVARTATHVRTYV